MLRLSSSHSWKAGSTRAFWREWADLLELRDDVTYEASHREWLHLVVWTLSDQNLNGAISSESVSHLLSLAEEDVEWEG
jgi:hypothetical protein